MKEYRIKFQNNRLLDTDGLNIEKMAENTYRISISNGSYNVRVYDGDLQDEGDVNVYTTLNGEKQFPIWAGDRVIRSQDYQTTVCKGIMDVEFSGKYVCIQGIDISLHRNCRCHIAAFLHQPADAASFVANHQTDGAL